MDTAFKNRSMTKLMIAARDGDLLGVKAAIRKGEDVNAISERNLWEWGKTALMYAAEFGHADIVRKLLQSGANTDIRNRSVSGESGGKNALHFAAEYGYTKIAQTLIDAGIDFCVVSESGNTALNLACMNGHVGIVKLLLSKAHFREQQTGKALLSAITSISEVKSGAKQAHPQIKTVRILQMLLKAGRIRMK